MRNKHVNVITLIQESKGIYKAWNQALIFLLSQISEDDYIMIINSDDWFIENYIDLISPYDGFDLIAGSSRVYYSKINFIRPCRNLKFLPIFMPIIDPSLSIKASVYREIGLYREGFLVASDHDFSYRAFEMGCKFKILKDVLVNIEMGGFAYQNRNKGFFEQYLLTKERCILPIPELAYLYRILKIPRFRLFDFL